MDHGNQKRLLQKVRSLSFPTMLKLALAILLVVGIASATLGVDFSKEICEGVGYSNFQCVIVNPFFFFLPSSSLRCLVQHGYSFAIIEAWQGGWGLTTNIGANVRAALAAGMAHVDVYARTTLSIFFFFFFRSFIHS